MVTDRPARMTTNEFFERLKGLIENNVAGSTQVLTGFLDLIKEASAVCPEDQMDVEEMLSRCLEFHLAAYSVVSTQGLALLHGLLSAARSSLITKGMPTGHPEPTVAPHVELRLSGRHGERVTTSFAIENRFDLPLAVTFESTELTPTEGPGLPSSLVAFEPPTVMIPPHGEGTVQAAVTITADFVVGQTYTATIRLLGFGEFERKELRLSLSILQHDTEVPTPSRPPRKPLQSAKRKPLRRTK